MASPTRHIFANWKMYLTLSESVALAQGLAEQAARFAPPLNMAIFPSALAFGGVREIVKNSPIKLGAQNVHWLDKGGYTGEVSAEMYREAGAIYALVGHSERRHLFHETNHEVREKVEALLLAGITPVVCVGETAEEQSRGETVEVVEAQLRAVYEGISWPVGRPIMVAYEPVWAIGTHFSCEPKQAAGMHELIHKFVQGLVPQSDPSILYGGSVREENVQSFLSEEYIHGVLVGGASIKLDSWVRILELAAAL